MEEEFEEIQRNMQDNLYKMVVGSLIYAMVGIRANLVFLMNLVSQFMSRAHLSHWMGVKHIMWYFKDSLYFKLYLGGKNMTLNGFCDIDWTGDENEL